MEKKRRGTANVGVGVAGRTATSLFNFVFRGGRTDCPKPSMPKGNNNSMRRAAEVRAISKTTDDKYAEDFGNVESFGI